jgi:pimeloyl-ACP methyl ester carboxylesterase
MTPLAQAGRPAACLVAGIVLTVALAAVPAGARGPRPGEPRPVSFQTADAVELQGTFYPGKRGGRSPAVLILNDLEENTQPKAWDRIAEALHKEGYAVLRFDFRGHGKSTAVGPEFWNVGWNQRYLKGRPRDLIRHQEFERHYPLMLVNDVSAARFYLELRHDASECDASRMVLLGSGSGAALGAVWLGTEWCRYRAYGGIGGRLAERPEGADVAGALWLNLAPEVMGRDAPVMNWLRIAGGGKGVPMGLMYGERDAAAERFARQVQGLYDDGAKLVHTRQIKGYSGTRELLAAPDTDSTISRYLAHLLREEEKPGGEPAPRTLKDPVEKRFVWVKPMRPAVLAKLEGEKALRLMSPAWLAES